MLRGETIAFHIYSLANISRGDKYPATIQLYSQYIPFITIKLVNPPLCFHHQDFWRLKNNFWWLNMCLLAITQKITGLVESGTLRETMLIKFSSIFPNGNHLKATWIPAWIPSPLQELDSRLAQPFLQVDGKICRTKNHGEFHGDSNEVLPNMGIFIGYESMRCLWYVTNKKADLQGFYHDFNRI